MHPDFPKILVYAFIIIAGPVIHCVNIYYRVFITYYVILRLSLAGVSVCTAGLHARWQVDHRTELAELRKFTT